MIFTINEESFDPRTEAGDGNRCAYCGAVMSVECAPSWILTGADGRQYRFCCLPKKANEEELVPVIGREYFHSHLLRIPVEVPKWEESKRRFVKGSLMYWRPIIQCA